MAEENRCPQCGAELPADAPHGLCPKCLMKVGLESDAKATIDDPGDIESPGTRIGRYKLLQLIGEGGMGLVYLAEQQEPVRRRVALKIVKPGMDSKQVIARFEAERQVLALLDHPNIAHIFDAGTTETARPYFAMEYVKGLSITKYCDERKLNIEQRLRLFEQVCEAVHYAHQKGIIHRDIKPSNILVSVQADKAVPKIIDFGIAKALTQPLTEGTLFTQQGQLLGTPEYMSPEQVDMATQDIDIRSDIYSLGAMLYELLAGILPFERELFERAGFVEIQQMIRELEPASPSVRLTSLGEKARKIAASRGTQVVPLARRLHRELEWIPLKAMRKDRCRRYRSASEMSDDIRNYLNGLPLIAGPETAMYRVKKFVRKHAGSVATTALVAAVIVLGLIVSTTMYFRAEKALQKESVARGVAEEARGIAEQARAAEAKQRQLAEEQAEKYRRSLYFNHIALADASYREGNISRVRELLGSCPEDLRRWEWNRLDNISDQALMTLRGHERPVVSVSFSPDGRRIVSGSNDKTIKVWDAATGAEVMALRGHEGMVSSVTFSPDGKRIVSSSYDQTIKIWDAATGDELMTLRGHERAVGRVSFSPDGKRIASGSSDKTIRVWDAESGTELMTLRGHEGSAGGRFSPDGRHIASWGRDQTIKIWDAKTGAELMTLSGHNDGVVGVAFSPDGTQIVSSSKDKTVKLWDAATGAEVITLRGVTPRLRSASFSPDGKRIVLRGEDNTIKVWEVASGTEILTLHGHGQRVTCAVFAPDGKRIVSSSWDKTVKVWDATIDREPMTLRGSNSFAFSPDSKRIVSGAGGGRIKVWDRSSGTELMTLHGHEEGISSVSFSPDGKHLVSGSYDKTVKVWDSATGAELMTLSGHKGTVLCVAFSPDERQIVSGSEDKTIRIWDATTGVEVMTLRGHDHWVDSVAFSPDGKRIVSSSDDKTIKVWDAATGAEMMTLLGHEHGVPSVAFSPDGKRIVSGSWDNTVKVWDAVTGTEILTLCGHGGPVIWVGFSPDDKRIVSSGFGTRAKVWDSATGTQLITLPGSGAITFSPDGKTIAISGESGIKLLESEVPVDGYKARRTGNAAQKVIDELYEKHSLYSEVINKLKVDNTLDEAVRKVALQIANARLWEDAEKLKKEAQDPGPEEAAGSEN